MTQSSRAALVTPAAALCHPLGRGVGPVRAGAPVFSNRNEIWLPSRSLLLYSYGTCRVTLSMGSASYVLVEVFCAAPRANVVVPAALPGRATLSGFKYVRKPMSAPAWSTAPAPPAWTPAPSHGRRYRLFYIKS